MLFLTLDVDAVEAPSIGDLCFTNQDGRPFFRQAGASSHLWALRITSLVQTERERKTQMLGLELSGLIG